MLTIYGKQTTEIQFRYRPFITHRGIRNGDLVCTVAFKTKRLNLTWQYRIPVVMRNPSTQ